MNYRAAILFSVFATLAVAMLSYAQVTPYSNSTQVGFHVVNISTYSVATVFIGADRYNITQNYITPSTSGETVNGHPYYLTLNAPMQISGQNNSYIMLVKVNYIPRQHTVNFNIYQLQPPATTTTTSVPSTSTTSVKPTTTIIDTTLPYTTIASTAPTTTTAQSSGSSINNILQRIISFLQNLFSHL